MFSPTDVAMLGGGVTDIEYNRLLAVTGNIFIKGLSLSVSLKLSNIVVDENYIFGISVDTNQMVKYNKTSGELIQSITLQLSTSGQIVVIDDNDTHIYYSTSITNSQNINKIEKNSMAESLFFTVSLGAGYSIRSLCCHNNLVYYGINNYDIWQINTNTLINERFKTMPSGVINSSVITVDTTNIYYYDDVSKSIQKVNKITKIASLVSSGVSAFKSMVVMDNTLFYPIFSNETILGIDLTTNSLKTIISAVGVVISISSDNKSVYFVNTTYNNVQKIMSVLEIVGWQKEE